MSDDRLKNTQRVDEKAPKTIDDRSSRSPALTKAEVEARLRGSMVGGILPVPPEKPGYTRVWLSETNKQNPISWYESLGYRKVHPKDTPNFGQEYLKSPSGIEEVRCNEMILYEIEKEIRDHIMKVNHHDMPLELQGRPAGDMRNRLVDPKTGESVYLNEADDEERAFAKRKVPTPKFE